MSAASDLLKQHLQQRQTKGATHIGLRPGTMERLLGQEPAPKLSDVLPATRRQEAAPAAASAPAVSPGRPAD
jgi:hypothetical protein